MMFFIGFISCAKPFIKDSLLIKPATKPDKFLSSRTLEIESGKEEENMFDRLVFRGAAKEGSYPEIKLFNKENQIGSNPQEDKLIISKEFKNPTRDTNINFIQIRLHYFWIMVNGKCLLALDTKVELTKCPVEGTEDNADDFEWSVEVFDRPELLARCKKALKNQENYKKDKEKQAEEAGKENKENSKDAKTPEDDSKAPDNKVNEGDPTGDGNSPKNKEDNTIKEDQDKTVNKENDDEPLDETQDKAAKNQNDDKSSDETQDEPKKNEDTDKNDKKEERKPDKNDNKNEKGNKNKGEKDKTKTNENNDDKKTKDGGKSKPRGEKNDENEDNPESLESETNEKREKSKTENKKQRPANKNNNDKSNEKNSTKRKAGKGANGNSKDKEGVDDTLTDDESGYGEENDEERDKNDALNADTNKDKELRLLLNAMKDFQKLSRA